MSLTFVILAAGQGSRMNSDLPKVLHPLGAVPLLHHALTCARSLEPSRIVVVTGHGGEAVAAAARDLDEGVQVARQEEQLGTAHAVRHGPRCRARIIVVSSEREAAQARSRVEGAADRRGAFIEEAIARSTDPSAPRGGLLEPISPADPAYPVSVRRALEALRAGELSPVVALENGYALLLLDERTEGDGTPIEAVRPELERLLRIRQERVLMDRTASQMLETARITVFDPSLEWSWRTRRQD